MTILKGATLVRGIEAAGYVLSDFNCEWTKQLELVAALDTREWALLPFGRTPRTDDYRVEARISGPQNATVVSFVFEPVTNVNEPGMYVRSLR